MRHQLSRGRWTPATAKASATAIASVVLLAGCSGGSGATAAGHLEQTTITVDAFEAIDTAGLFIAQQDGLFAAQGLTVNLRPQTFVQSQIDDLAKGTADFASGDYVSFVENETGGDPDLGGRKPNLRIVAESSFLQPDVLDVVIPPHSATTSIAALHKKSISVLAPRNISDILVDSLLVGHDIPVGDEHYPFVAFPDIGTAFGQGKMDAAFAPEPFVTTLEESAGVKQLADLDQGSTTNFPIQGMVTTQSWAQRNPDTLRAFLRAYNQGQFIASTNRTEVSRVLQAFLHLPANVAGVVSLPAFPQGVDPIRLQRTVSAMLRFKILGPQFNGFNIRSMLYRG